MKICSTPLSIREMKTKIRSHYTVTRIAEIKKKDHIKCWRGYGGTRNFSYPPSKNARSYIYFEKQLNGFLKNTKHILTTQTMSSTPRDLLKRNENRSTQRTARKCL